MVRHVYCNTVVLLNIFGIRKPYGTAAVKTVDREEKVEREIILIYRVHHLFVIVISGCWYCNTVVLLIVSIFGDICSVNDPKASEKDEHIICHML